MAPDADTLTASPVLDPHDDPSVPDDVEVATDQAELAADLARLAAEAGATPASDGPSATGADTPNDPIGAPEAPVAEPVEGVTLSAPDPARTGEDAPVVQQNEVETVAVKQAQDEAAAAAAPAPEELPHTDATSDSDRIDNLEFRVTALEKHIQA